MSKKTTNHQTIKNWAQAHNANPAIVNAKSGDTSILRFDLAGQNDDLHIINWEHFFELFEANELALLYESDSNFNKFIGR